MSKSPKPKRKPDARNVRMYGTKQQIHFCRQCVKNTTHVVTAECWSLGDDGDGPYLACENCGTLVPENPVHHCCRRCDPIAYAMLDQGLQPPFHHHPEYQKLLSQAKQSGQLPR